VGDFRTLTEIDKLEMHNNKYLCILALMNPRSYKILVVEDEELYVDKIEIILKKLGHKVVGICDNGDETLEIIKESKPEIILMDIHIRGQYDGIELASKLLSENQVCIIFITSIRDDLTFARAKRVGASNFIIKPFDDLQLQRAIELASENIIKNDTKQADYKDGLFVKHAGKLIKLDEKDIYYLEADGHYCWVFIEQHKYLLQKPLKDLIEILPVHFIQPHRSFAVNKSKISVINIKDQTIEILGRSIPISRRNYGEIIAQLGHVLK